MPTPKKSARKKPAHEDPDYSKGAVESDGNSSLRGQLGHRDQNPLIKSSDTDFPEPGGNPEHSGEPEEHDQR